MEERRFQSKLQKKNNGYSELTKKTTRWCPSNNGSASGEETEGRLEIHVISVPKEKKKVVSPSGGRNRVLRS